VLINEKVKEEVEKISIIDTHEHIMPEVERGKYALDFSYLFGHYNSSDLISAGMPPNLLEAVRLPMYNYQQWTAKRTKSVMKSPEPEREDMSLEERWRAIEPYWERIRNTAYAKATLIAIKDLFGIEDLNRKTYVSVSEAIANSRKSGWYQYVMKEKANIDLSIINIQMTDVDQELFRSVMSLDNFVAVRTRQELVYLEEETGMAIHSLGDLVEAMRISLEKYVTSGIVGVKSALAYQRILQYDKVPRNEAEVIFNRIASHLGEGPSWQEAKPLQDYMMHQLIRAVIDIGLPMQIHTGLHEGNANIITNSNPTHLVNLFIEYPEARFDLFHGGYPYIHEWTTLAKNFANVYSDLCWVHLISPAIGSNLLNELIETVPGNKIMAFGGDSITVEIAYAHSCIARQVVSRVLSEKVSEGYMLEDEAIDLARKILRDNPAALFGE